MSTAAAATDAVAPKKGKKKLIIIVAAVLLVVLAGGGAALMMMKKKAAAEGEALHAVQALQALLQADDPAARLHLLHHAPLVQEVVGPRMAALQAHVEQFDYESALGLLTGCLERFPQAATPPGAACSTGSRDATRQSS